MGDGLCKDPFEPTHEALLADAGAAGTANLCQEWPDPADQSNSVLFCGDKARVGATRRQAVQPVVPADRDSI